MQGMFWGCLRLTSLDVSSFNTSNVTDMNAMFGLCSNVTSLDVSNFNTSNVTDMNSMFQGCGMLISLDLSNFNTQSVINMDYMFSSCIRLTALDLSNFDMSHLGYTRNDVTYSGKGRMCQYLSTTSEHCTITCTEATQTALESGTYLPTSGVTFTWVRPTSSK